MGGSSWSSSFYDDRAKARAATGTPAFAYDADVRTGKVAAGVHKSLDVKGVKFRESRDSTAHPESLAIGVIFDETGSMGHIPVTLQKKLAGLMTLLVQKGYTAHPQVLFGAIGDATNGERAPLQIGQFESGLEMEDDLTNIYLEGSGGGHITETYELAHYFFAKHTSIDCWEKRGKKGYFFTIGDEAPYPFIGGTTSTQSKHAIQEVVGDHVQDGVPTPEVIAELQTRYHVFHIIALTGSQGHNPAVHRIWRDLLGDHVLQLQDPDGVAELIALTIGLTEGVLDLDAAADHLKDVGADHKIIAAATSALTPYAKATGLAKKGAVTGNLPAVQGGGTTERL